MPNASRGLLCLSDMSFVRSNPVGQVRRIAPRQSGYALTLSETEYLQYFNEINGGEKGISPVFRTNHCPA